MINYENDIWIVEDENKSVGNFFTFDFTHFEADKLKKQVKDYMWFNLKRDSIKASTLHRYSYSLKAFTDFIKEEGYMIESCNDITATIVDHYILYLNQVKHSPSSMCVCYTAIKSVVRHGQFMELDDYPKQNIFPLITTKLFGLTDVLKTKAISDLVFTQIETALEKEENIIFRSCMEIVKETGLRLSEVLLLEEGCVMRDFVDMPILFTYSLKNDNERAIPISERLALIISELEAHTRKAREKVKTKRLFLIKRTYGKKKGQYRQYLQSMARQHLDAFIINNNIVDETGKYAKFTFHSFRHTVGTRMISAGVHPININTHLGHQSMHSTGIYSKITDVSLQHQYESIGFLGFNEKYLGTEEKLNEIKKMAEEKIITASLPNGRCMKPFEGDEVCSSFNSCLLCSKFRTYIDDLPIHKEQLTQIRKDKEKYMKDMSIASIEYLERIEAALEVIIEQLEALKHE